MILTFEEIKEEYFNYLNLKSKYSTSRDTIDKINRHIFKYIKNKNIYEFSFKDFIEWQSKIVELNLSYSYKSSLQYAFNKLFDYLMLNYNINKNIPRIVGNFKNDEIEKTGNIWNLNEFNLFIKFVDDQVYKTLFDLLFFTGLRKGELLALTWNDIDFNNNTISISKTITRYKNSNNSCIIQSPKTKKSIRKICFDNVLKKELINLHEYYTTKYEDFNENFFIFGGKKNISFTTLKRKKDFYCKKSGVKQIKIHEFRHSHAVLLYTNNIPIKDISSRLGHESINTTADIYLKYLPQNEKRVINTLNHLRLN